MLRSDREEDFLGKEFTAFVDGEGIVHDLTCTYKPQQNDIAEQEMRMAVEAVRTMLLHMGVQHNQWHLALRQAAWVRNCLEWSVFPSGTTPHQLLTSKKPDLTLARVWGCMVPFKIPEQQRGEKLVPKARWGLHLGVSSESKGWEVLDLTDNMVVMTVEAIFYEMELLKVWKTDLGPASQRTPANPPTDTSTAIFPLLAKIVEPDVQDVHPPSLPPPPTVPPLVTELQKPMPASATGNQGSLGLLPVAPASAIASGQRDVEQDGKKR
ncbi:unnamed protein product [Closterium sp. NIES-53]